MVMTYKGGCNHNKTLQLHHQPHVRDSPVAEHCCWHEEILQEFAT